jgi:hypothetical protein
MASQRSLRGLDWFAFFVADVQTGWGPFVATYLTSVAWTQFDIGLILSRDNHGSRIANPRRRAGGSRACQTPARRSCSGVD